MRSSWIALIGLTVAGLTSQAAGAFSLFGPIPVCPLGAPYIFRAGLADEFAAPVDETARGAALNAAFPTASWKDFNDATPNRFVGHTFTGLPGDITRAELVVRAKPHRDVPFNDSIDLGLVPPNQFVVSFRFASLPEAHGTWDVGSNGPTTFTVELGPDQILLGQMSSQHTLDVLIQDDTAVDYMELRVWVCPPPTLASGLANQEVGQAHFTVDGLGGLVVSNVGPSGDDGVKVQAGQSSLMGMALSGLDSAPVGSFLDLNAESVGPAVSGRLQRESDSWSFTADPAALGTSVSQVRVYDTNHRLVGAFPQGSGTVHFDSPPQAIFVGGAHGPNPNPDPNPPCDPHTETTVYSCHTENRGNSCVESTDPTHFNLTTCCASQRGDVKSYCETTYTWSICWLGPLNFWSGPYLWYGNCLYWDYGPQFRNPFADLQVTSNTNFAVTQEKLGIGGFPASALGGATMDESASGLRLSNLGTGSGVALDTQRTANAHVLLAAIDPLRASPSGAFLQADVTGSLNGTPDQPLGTLKGMHVMGAGLDQLSVTTDFSALGAATQRVEVYDQGNLVTAVHGSSGPVVHQGINVVVIWPVTLDTLSGGGFGLTWSGESRFTLPGGTTVTGDELRLVPEASAASSIDYVAGLAVHPSGLPELTILDVRASSCEPVLSGQPVDVTTAAGRPAVFSVAATSASPLSYRWRRNGVDLADGLRIAGSATASLTLSPTILAQAGSYDVVVSNACGSVVSTTAAYTPGVALRTLLLSLIGNVQSLVGTGTLSDAQATNLSRALLHAADFLHDGNFPAAANRVDVFIFRVNAFVRTGSLSASQGKALTDAAGALRAHLAG
ncbi:MAG TPA: immunoglobulin domain-containing protein [Thermoanaerobaculia bacterium]|jgi:hypothetical protein